MEPTKKVNVKEEEEEEDIPDYTTWSFDDKKINNKKEQTIEEEEDEEYTLPDYSNWKIQKSKKQTEIKEEETDLFEDVSKNKLDLFKQILEDSKKEDKFKFLEEEEEEENLSFEEWKQKKFDKKTIKKNKEPLNLLNLINNEENTIETNMNKDEHKQFLEWMFPLTKL
eukprot:gene4798-8384_t